MQNRGRIAYIIKSSGWKVTRAPLSAALAQSVSRASVCIFLGGGCLSGWLKVRCCWKDSEVQLLVGQLHAPQRPLSAAEGRAWSASVSLKWYPQLQHHPASSNIIQHHPAQHPHRQPETGAARCGVTSEFSNEGLLHHFCAAASVTNHQSCFGPFPRAKMYSLGGLTNRYGEAVEIMY